MAIPVKVLVPYYLASFMLLVAFGIFKLIHLFPCTDKLIEKLVKLLSTIEMQRDDYWKTLFGRKMFKSYRKIILRELQKQAHSGRKAPNPDLSYTDGNTKCKLLDSAHGDRPLVVNFGSCTCPVFMAKLSELSEIIDKFHSVADFITIYIEEAHPLDEWSLENNVVEIPQHTSLEERCKAAKVLLETASLKTPLLVDSLSNSASRDFAAVPNRLYIIQNEIIKYAGGVGPTFYKPQEVDSWLEKWSQNDVNNNCPKTADSARREAWA